MSYQEMSDRYRGDRSRYEMAVREQAHLTFSNSADPAEKFLADKVIAVDLPSIDAVISAICVGPNSATLDDDVSLLGAVQTAWPITATAIYSLEA